MLTKKQNLLETLKRDGHPDRFVNQYNPFVFITSDPIMQFTRGNRVRGTTSKDQWGTTILFPEDQFAAMPHVTEENKVCPDITEWRKYVKVPDLEANCTDWSACLADSAKVDRDEQMTMVIMGTGIFEQCHFLMGFEDTLMNLLLEPEDMEDLIQAIADYRYTYTKMLIENLKPDAILSHDDWGSKASLFFSPEVWRTMFKPHYKKLYRLMKENGVLVVHHADSYLEPIIEDMVEIGVDVWQGVLPQNDIVKMGKILDGRMGLMGGIDAAVVDRADAAEEKIRSEVRNACTKYRNVKGFMPCMTYGGPGSMFPHVDAIITDEINKCSAEMF